MDLRMHYKIYTVYTSLLKYLYFENTFENSFSSYTRKKYEGGWTHRLGLKILYNFIHTGYSKNKHFMEIEFLTILNSPRS